MHSLLLAILSATVATAQAEPVAHPKMAIPTEGFIFAKSGDKVSYVRSVARETYFAGLDSEVYRLKFSGDRPLPNDSGNKMMLANLIVRFYVGTIVHADAKFETRFEDWKPATKLQAKGYYVPCVNYPQQRIWIDLRLTPDGKGILEAIVSEGFRGLSD